MDKEMLLRLAGLGCSEANCNCRQRQMMAELLSDEDALRLAQQLRLNVLRQLAAIDSAVNGGRGYETAAQLVIVLSMSRSQVDIDLRGQRAASRRG